jgi:hypothetical protein
METLFDPVVQEQVLRRVDALQASAPRQWGKMSASQMLEHTARALEMAAGKRESKQALLGKLIGWMFRGGFVGPKPFAKNGPTGPDFIVKDEPNFPQAKARLRALLVEFHGLGERGCEGNVHGFFGRMTGREWGTTQYKHVDHHLRQFNA